MSGPDTAHPPEAREEKQMAACETCWNTAFRIARMTGRQQADVYQELIKARPTDGSHGEPSSPADFLAGR